MFDSRIKKIKENLTKEYLDAILISSVANITYLTGYSNFSKEEREAYIIISNKSQFIITDGRYIEAIKAEVPHFEIFERGSEISIKELFKNLNIKILGIEEDNLTVSEHKTFKKYFKTKNFEVDNLRSIKNNEEIRKIKRACEIGDLAFKYILKKIKTGVSEKEIAYELEHFVKQQGADLSFPPIVGFGKNSSVPHHSTGKEILGRKSGQFILFDFGVKVDNYCSDMTRTIFFGQPSKKQQDLYQTVLNAQKKTVEFINSFIESKKEIKAFEADKVARDYIVSFSYPTIPHSLGHGIGLQVHEHPYISPRNEEVLKEGMVFSIEPGIYIPGYGGVRIEDLYIYEKNGLRQLTASSKEIIII